MQNMQDIKMLHAKLTDKTEEHEKTLARLLESKMTILEELRALE
jgi:hypothetical protein